MPPWVTFATDIFHPLLTPLTTYTYTTGAADTDTVSATDEERLPPGGFSLRHGFPEWFERTSEAEPKSSLEHPTAVDVLQYIRSAFDDATVLDSVPLRAAGNPGAWHAWRSYRSKAIHDSQDHALASTTPSDGDAKELVNTPDQQAGARASSDRKRRPGEWDWDGVWEERARKGIEGSIAEPVLYGNAVAGDDIVGHLRSGNPMGSTTADSQRFAS